MIPKGESPEVMSSEPIELGWGKTPWDKLTQPELLREVQRMYTAIVALNSCLRINRAAAPLSSYWGRDGSGGEALEMARQILDPLYDKFDAETIYRSFFRYARDLLFDSSTYRIGSGWAVCPICGTMLGETHHPNGTRSSAVGQPCRYGDDDCKGVFRMLEWADLEAH